VIVVGGGAGRGVVSDAHYLGQTFAAGYELWRDADVVLGVGSRMQPYLQEWGVDSGLKIVRIDWDPTEINRIVEASAVAALLEKPKKRRPPPPQPCIRRCTPMRESWLAVRHLRARPIRNSRSATPRAGRTDRCSPQCGPISRAGLRSLSRKTLQAPHLGAVRLSGKSHRSRHDLSRSTKWWRRVDHRATRCALRVYRVPIAEPPG